MADDKALKSSYELAMERLRKTDAEAGVEERTLTEAQKAAIGEVRTFYKAKLAEHEILSQSRLRQTIDPAERESLQADFQRDNRVGGVGRNRDLEGRRGVGEAGLARHGVVLIGIAEIEAVALGCKGRDVVLLAEVLVELRH